MEHISTILDKQEFSNPPKTDIYQQITDTIVKQLEAGTVPWQQSWTTNNQAMRLPQNAVTGNHYRGTNILLLWSAAIDKKYTSNQWASFKQWKSKNEYIRKGEKGNFVVYADTFEKEVDGEVKEIPFLKYSLVFNRCQLASYDSSLEQAPESKSLVEKIALVEDFIENTFATIEHHDGDAYYTTLEDKIYMPHAALFHDTKTCTATENYYSTKLHELIHWTKHPSRLNRDLSKYGDAGYAEEELIAELGSAFLVAEFGICEPEKTDHAAYIAHWLKILKNDKQFIVKAARGANKAVQFMKDKQPLKL